MQHIATSVTGWTQRDGQSERLPKALTKEVTAERKHGVLFVKLERCFVEKSRRRPARLDCEAKHGLPHPTKETKDRAGRYGG